MSDKTNSDVEKALASFGGMSLKYRSFGLPVLRPASGRPAALPDSTEHGPALAAPAFDSSPPNAPLTNGSAFARSAVGTPWLNGQPNHGQPNHGQTNHGQLNHGQTNHGQPIYGLPGNGEPPSGGNPYAAHSHGDAIYQTVVSSPPAEFQTPIPGPSRVPSRVPSPGPPHLPGPGPFAARTAPYPEAAPPSGFAAPAGNPAAETPLPAAFPLLRAVLPQAAQSMTAPPPGRVNRPPPGRTVAPAYNPPGAPAGDVADWRAPASFVDRRSPAAASPHGIAASAAVRSAPPVPPPVPLAVSPAARPPALRATPSPVHPEPVAPLAFAPPPAEPSPAPGYAASPYSASPGYPAQSPPMPQSGPPPSRPVQQGWPLAAPTADAFTSPLASAIEARMAPRERRGASDAAQERAAEKTTEALGFTALGAHLARAEQVNDRRNTAGHGDRRGRDEGAPMAQQPGFASLPADRRSVAEMFRVLAGRNDRGARQDVFRPSDEPESVLFRRL